MPERAEPMPAAAAMPPRMRTAVVALLCVVILTLPFTSSVALRYVALWSAFAITVAWMLRHRGLGHRLPPVRLWLPIACWSAWCVLSVAWSVDPMHSAMQLRPELLVPLAGFFLFYVFTEDAAALDRWAWSLAVGLALLALIAFAQRLAHGEWDARPWHGNVGYYSTHAVIALPFLAWAWLRTGSQAWRSAIVATGAATVVVVFWTENRMSWLALGGMAAVGALLAARRRPPAQRRRLALVGLLCIAALGTLFLLAQRERLETLEARGQGLRAELANDPRPRIWTEGVGRIGETPWLGRGFGRGTLRQPASWPGDGIQNPKQWHAHNIFINVVLALGPLGLALFLWVWGAFAREFAAALHAPAPLRWAAVIGVALLAGLALKNFTDDFFVRHIALAAWSLAGALAGLARQANPR